MTLLYIYMLIGFAIFMLMMLFGESDGSIDGVPEPARHRVLLRLWA